MEESTVANYYHEIDKMLRKIVTKALITDRQGLKLGTKGEVLSFLELYILREIGEKGNKKISELIDEMQLNRGMASLVFKKLVINGYVSKKQSEEDRRVYGLMLTDLGKQIVDKSMEDEKKLLEFILADISLNEERAVLKFLSKLNQGAFLKTD